jgi:spore protease
MTSIDEERKKQMFSIRTDLAVETSEQIKSREKLSGVSIKKRSRREDITITEVVIETKKAAARLQKPQGIYVTMEAPLLLEGDREYQKEVSKELSRELRKLLPPNYVGSKILIAGLGNRQVTPDALGPKVIDQLLITRHLIREYGKYLWEFSECCSVSSMVPGVMAQTGMEAAEVLKGVAGQIQPDVILVIDALAARSISRLNRTIQITDTGIVPGSGVGNHRCAINRQEMGVPVISIGIPTVVDAATIVTDAFGNFMEQRTSAADAWNTKEEMEEQIRRILPPKLYTMYVTPKDIDEAVERLSHTIAEGLNATFVPGEMA